MTTRTKQRPCGPRMGAPVRRNFPVAIPQFAPVYTDKAASVEKAIRLRT